MIPMVPGTKVYLACHPVSMRLGFDGLAARVAQVLDDDPGRHGRETLVPLHIISIEHHNLVPSLDEIFHEARVAVATGIDIGDGAQLRV